MKAEPNSREPFAPYRGHRRAALARLMALRSRSISEAVTDSEAPQDHQPVQDAPHDARAHTEIQWLLLKLGNDMGLDVWVARNDRSKRFEGNALDGLERSK